MTPRLLSLALPALLALWLGLVPSVGMAQTAGTAAGETTAERLDRWDVEASSIEILLNQDPPDIDEIAELTQLLGTQLQEAPKIAAAAGAQMAPLSEQLEALGPDPEDATPEASPVADQRRDLTRRLAEIEALQKRATQAEVRAKALAERLLERRRQLFTEELITRGPTLAHSGVPRRAVESLQLAAERLIRESRRRLDRSGMGMSAATSLSGLGLVLIIAVVFLFRARRAVVRRLLARIDDDTPHPRRVAIATAITLTRLLGPALSLSLVLFAAWSSGILGRLGIELLTGLARAAALVIGAYALGGAFFSPRAPQLRLSTLSNRAASQAHRWLVLLAAVVGLDNALIVHGTKIGLGVEALTLINTVLLMLGGLTLWKLVHAMSASAAGSSRAPEPVADATAEADAPEDAEANEPQVSFMASPLLARGIRALLLFAALGAPVLALAGYYAASRYLFYPLVYSGAVVGFCILLFHVVRELVDQAVRTEAERGAEDGPRSIRLIPIIVGVFLFAGALPVLALIWGASAEDLLAAWRRAVSGFTIGDVVISPIDFFIFLLLFSIGYVLTRLVQRLLSTSVLPLTRLDTGGRAAVRAGVGYVGITIAVLVAISATGLDLSNLAIVAGALSVGIGFGLQNIVNNFVSGIILLVERPIKAGDWIEIASGMGYVKQVNVRSTEIETFDRSSLIVPNSELISSNVINWTHGNLHGRLKVPVGVAYGTDTRKVERILLDIAKAHPMVLRRPAPWVYFQGFGDSALEFEIRAVLRDVNWVMNVRTDINHEIARRFAEEAIEIPFPQRELRLRDVDDIGAALRGRDLAKDGDDRDPA